MRKDIFSLFINYFMKISVLILGATFFSIIFFIFKNGVCYVDFDTLKGVFIPVVNTINIIILTIFLSGIFGIGGSIYLCFYTKDSSVFSRLVLLSVNTLASIPSIVYGLFGYLAFVIFCGFKISFISGVLTLSIMCLPVVLASSLEALKSVDENIIKGAYALGANKLKVIILCLKTARKEILSTLVLAVAKIISESAALIYTFGTLLNIAKLDESGRTLSVHLYVLASEGLELNAAYASSLVLIVFITFVCIVFNFLSKE